jgi:diacylglycerol kinase family enzyme
VLKQIDWAVLAELATSNFTRADLGLEIQHWRGRSVTAVAEPPQAVAIGGDMIGVSPVQARVLPGALRVVTPR